MEMIGEASQRVELVRQRLELLYDATGGIGTTLDVTRTAEELAQVAVPRFADYVTVDLAEPVLRGDEPGDGTAQPTAARECGARPSAASATTLPSSPSAT